MNWENYCALDGLTAVRLGYKWLTFVFSMIAGTHFANVKTFPQGFKKITFFFFFKFTYSVFYKFAWLLLKLFLSVLYPAVIIICNFIFRM